MRRQILALALMLILTLAALTGTWLLRRMPVPAPEVSGEAEPMRFEGEVLRVEIETADESYSLTADSVGEAPKAMLDGEAARSALVQLGSIRPTRRIGKQDGNLAKYGLEPPNSAARVVYADGGTLEIRVGGIEPVTGGVYCKLGGDADVYLLEPAEAEILTAPMERYLLKVIVPECAAANAVAAIGDITFIRPDGEIRICACAEHDADMAREMLSFGLVTHLVRGEGIWHEVDRTYALQMFGALLGFRAESIEALNPTPAQIEGLGFEKPDMLVRFDLKNTDDADAPWEAWTLRLVAGEGGSVVAMVDGVPAIYRAVRPAFMDADYAGFVMRQFVSPMLMDLSAVEIKLAQRSYAWSIEGTGSDLVARMDGQDMDTAAFRAFYSLLVSAASNGEPARKEVGGTAPEMTVRYVYRDADKAPDALAFFAEDARILSVSVNGVREFAMRRRYLEAVVSAVDAMMAGEDFDKTW